MATLEVVYLKTSYLSKYYNEAEATCEVVNSDRPEALPQNKVEAIKFILPWMPQINNEFYFTFLAPDQNTGRKKTARREINILFSFYMPKLIFKLNIVRFATLYFIKCIFVERNTKLNINILLLGVYSL